jgi:hypothetical protein
MVAPMLSGRYFPTASLIPAGRVSTIRGTTKKMATKAVMAPAL